MQYDRPFKIPYLLRWQLLIERSWFQMIIKYEILVEVERDHIKEERYDVKQWHRC